MKIVFVATGVMPYYTSSGSSVLMYGLLTILRDLGFEVTVIPVSLGYTEWDQYELYKTHLIETGFKVKEIVGLIKAKHEKSSLDLLRQAIIPRDSDFAFSNIKEKERIVEFIVENNIELVMGYSMQGVSIIHNLPNVKKIASIVDLPQYFAKRQRDVLKRVKGKSKIKGYLRLLARRQGTYLFYEYLKDMDLIIEHAAQHATELKTMGFRNVHYLPHPLPKKNHIPSRIKRSSNPRCIVLIAGSLKGVASRLGFDFFLNELLPAFKIRSNLISIEIKFRIVGHGRIMPDLKSRLLQEPMVEFIGFVEDIEQEYINADILLVNIPVSHGFRTRIAEAFSYGMCVVAHSANADGMPELLDGENALLDSDPECLAWKLTNAISQPELRYTLGQNAMATFDEKLSLQSASVKLKSIFQANNFIPY